MAPDLEQARRRAGASTKGGARERRDRQRFGKSLNFAVVP